MQSHQARPQRFQVFNQLPNGKGFTIKDSKYIYLFDKYGGWYDQYNNYYNQDGQPEDSPSDQDDDFQRFILQDQADFDDQYDDYYEKQYGCNNHNSDLDQQQIDNPIEITIAKNIAILADYPLKIPMRVDFRNMNYNVTKQQIMKFYKNKSKGILNVIMNKQNGKFIGQGYFVCEDATSAQKIVKLEGQQFSGRKIYFDVQSIDSFLMDPVTKQQKNIVIQQDDFQPLVKQLPKIQISKEQPKKKKFVDKKTKQTQKQTQKQQVAKIEDKPKPIKQPTWSKYKGEFYMFPQKSSFLDWMKQLGFKLNDHFKNIQKIPNTDEKRKWKTIQIRSDAFAKIQDSIYLKQKVHFEKIN